MNDRLDRARRSRVLITTASVGAGHRSVADAIVDSLKRAAGHLEVDCVDALDFAPRLFRAYYAGGFAMTMSVFPFFYGVGFRLTNLPSGRGRTFMERVRLWRESMFLRRLAKYVEQTRPALVVNTHFLPAPLIGRMIRRGRISTRQWVVVTDICVHRFWYSENVERWFAPAEASAAVLRQWGISGDEITVSGIPIHAKWTQPTDRDAALQKWGLPRDKKIVTLSGGTDFTCGPVRAIARSLLDCCDELHLVVLVGRRDKLARRLSRFAEAGGRMTVVPYTDRLHELLEVSSLMVTKAGGVTTAECLAKGVPMVLMKPVPGHEAGNARHLQGRRAAVIARGCKEIASTARRLLADEGELGRMSENARGLYRPATETVVNSICRALPEEPGLRPQAASDPDQSRRSQSPPSRA